MKNKNIEKNPTSKKYSENDQFIDWLINKLGIELITNKSPPKFTIIPSERIKGSGLILNILQIVIVRGITKKIHRIFIDTEENINVKKHKITRIRRLFPLENCTNLNAMKINTPLLWQIVIMIIMPKINKIV